MTTPSISRTDRSQHAEPLTGNVYRHWHAVTVAMVLLFACQKRPQCPISVPPPPRTVVVGDSPCGVPSLPDPTTLGARPLDTGSDIEDPADDRFVVTRARIAALNVYVLRLQSWIGAAQECLAHDAGSGAVQP